METWKHSGGPLFGRPRAQGVHISFLTSSMIPRRIVIPMAGCWMMPSLHQASQFTNPLSSQILREIWCTCCVQGTEAEVPSRGNSIEKREALSESSSCPVFSVLPRALNKQSYHFEDSSPYRYECFLVCLFCDHPCVYTYMLFSHNCPIF